MLADLRHGCNCSIVIVFFEAYHISLVIRWNCFVFFLLPKQSQKSRSILQDGSRFLGLFRKGKTFIIAKFHRTNLVICSYSREGKAPSYSQISMVGGINSC